MSASITPTNRFKHVAFTPTALNSFAVHSRPERRMQMSASITPINRFKHVAFTPTALNSRAQRRAAHAGVSIAHMIEPQRGSTNNFQNAN